MSNNNKPTIIIGCGLHHVAHHYRYLVAALESHGYEKLHTVQLPSVSKTAIPNAMEADVAAIRKAIEHTSGEILLVLHSWSAFIGCAALQGFEKRIKGVVFVAGWLQPSGQSSCAWLGIPALPIYHPPKEGVYEVLDAKETFFNDLSGEEVDDAMGYIISFLDRSVGHTALGYEYPWEKGVECTYVVCEEDNAIPPVFAEKMMKDTGFRGKVVRMRGGHAPFLGEDREDLVRIVRRAAGEDVDVKGETKSV